MFRVDFGIRGRSGSLCRGDFVSRGISLDAGLTKRARKRSGSLAFDCQLSTFDCTSNRDSRSSEKMFSTSKTGTSNSLIGTPFTPSRPLSPNLTPSSPSPAPNYVSFQKLLVSSLTPSKSATSQFLIDNFERSFALNPPWRVEATTASKQLAAQAGHSIFNRPAPRLETLVSHRKQTFALISNRPQFAFYNSGVSSRSGRFCTTSSCSRLSTINCQLRYNGEVKFNCNSRGDPT
jgi:hypothetical protein